MTDLGVHPPRRARSSKVRKRDEGAELFCRSIGNGKPLVVVHGGPGLGYGYLVPHFRTLADRYRLVFYDQRGCGRSAPLANDSMATLEQCVEDLEGLRRSFGFERMSLAGQSWGAIIAIHYAVSIPAGREPSLLERRLCHSEYLAEFQKTILERLSGAERDEMTRIATSPELAAYSPEAFRSFMRIRSRGYFHDPSLAARLDLDYFDRERVEKFFASSNAFASYLMSFDLQPVLAEVQVPTLIVHGAEDQSHRAWGACVDRRLRPARGWRLWPLRHRETGCLLRLSRVPRPHARDDSSQR